MKDERNCNINQIRPPLLIQIKFKKTKKQKSELIVVATVIK